MAAARPVRVCRCVDVWVWVRVGLSMLACVPSAAGVCASRAARASAFMRAECTCARWGGKGECTCVRWMRTSSQNLSARLRWGGRGRKDNNSGSPAYTSPSSRKPNPPPHHHRRRCRRRRRDAARVTLPMQPLPTSAPAISPTASMLTTHRRCPPRRLQPPSGEPRSSRRRPAALAARLRGGGRGGDEQLHSCARAGLETGRRGADVECVLA